MTNAKPGFPPRGSVLPPGMFPVRRFVPCKHLQSFEASAKALPPGYPVDDHDEYLSLQEHAALLSAAEAAKEEAVRKSLLDIEEKIGREVELSEEGELEDYRAGYEQAVDDCRMWIRAAAVRARAPRVEADERNDHEK